MLPKTTKNLFQCSNMVSRILKYMLEPYPDIVAFKRIVYNGLPLYSFFKDEWFTTRKLVIILIMTMVNPNFVALWLHSWPWVWNKKTWPWNNHGQPWSTMKTWFSFSMKKGLSPPFLKQSPILATPHFSWRNLNPPTPPTPFFKKFWKLNPPLL